VLLVAMLVGPFAVEWIAGRVIEQRLEKRAVELDWEHLEWSWSDRLTLTGVAVEGPGGRQVEMPRLEFDLAVGRSLVGEPRLDAVQLDGVEVDLQVSQFVGAEGDSSGTGGDGDASSKAGARRLVDRLRWGLGRVSEVRVQDVEVRLARRDLRLAVWSGDVQLSTASGALTGSGELRIAPFDDPTEMGWQVDGTAAPDLASVSGDVGLAGAGGRDDSKASLSTGRGQAALDGFSFELSLTPPIWGEASLAEPEFRLEHADKMVFEVAGPMVSVAARRSGTAPRLSVGARGLRLTADTGGMRSVVSGGSSSADGAGGDTDIPGADMPVGPRELAYRFVESVDVELRETILRLRHGSGDETRTLEPAEAVHVRKDGRHLAVTGDVAAGKLHGAIHWAPGLVWPARASVQLENVDLEEVPVVRKGRTLPNRGVRGDIGGRVDLTGRVRRVGLPGTLGERVDGHVDVGWRAGRLEADGLADEPVRGIDTSVRLSGNWAPALNRLRIDGGRFQYADLEAELSGALTDWPIDPFFTFRARFAPFECQRAVRSLPEELLGPYRDVTIDGKAEPVLGLDVPLDAPADLSLTLEGFPGDCKVTALNTREAGWPEVEFRTEADGGGDSESEEVRRHAALPEPAEPLDEPPELESIPSIWNPARPDDVFWLRKPFVKPVTEGVSDEADVQVGPGLDSYVPLEEMPPYVGGAAYLSEEINFYRDGGWNLALIERALQTNFEEERFVYGGSTVTQQLVKNLFLTRRKTLARKVREAIIAWRIQGVVRKDRVLELYLNCIEFGEDLYGIGPAAKHYFDKPAAELTPLQAVFLAVIKPAPWFGDRFRDEGTTPESGWWYDRIDEIMGRLVDKAFIDESTAEGAKPYVLEWNDNGTPVSDDGDGAGGDEDPSSDVLIGDPFE
jgi:hypothetical protein